jgi:hypothetical protein
VSIRWTTLGYLAASCIAVAIAGGIPHPTQAQLVALNLVSAVAIGSLTLQVPLGTKILPAALKPVAIVAASTIGYQAPPHVGPIIRAVFYTASLPAGGSGQVQVSQVQVNINVTASTQYGQFMYVTGGTATLGNWVSERGIQLDPFTHPVWETSLKLPANSSFQYKYYRKNPDGSVTWECYPGNGYCNANRSLTTPSSGTVDLYDTVSWE